MSEETQQIAGRGVVTLLEDRGVIEYDVRRWEFWNRRMARMIDLERLIQLKDGDELGDRKVYITLLNDYVMNCKYRPVNGQNPFKDDCRIGMNNSLLIKDIVSAKTANRIWWSGYWLKCVIQKAVSMDIEFVLSVSDSGIATPCNFGLNIESFGRYTSNYFALWQFDDEFGAFELGVDNE